MKRYILLGVVIVLACLVSAYWGFCYGSQHVVTARAGTAITELDALKNLRAGDTEAAIGKLEGSCFMNAAEVLSQSGWRTEAFRKIEVASLVSYREAYRTNQAEWSPMEQRLEILVNQKP
ncbi:MAG TPA: hypothetical protein VL863_00130 [bacterium]|nr:hypothetical protein [bacterium]